jgi:hypothetical protein
MEVDHRKVTLDPPDIPRILERIESGKGAKVDRGRKDIDRHKKMKRLQAEVGRVVAGHYGETFIQTPESGKFATIHKDKLTPEMARVLAGDICVSHARFTIEAKAGYDRIDPVHLFGAGDDNGKSSRDSVDDWIVSAWKEAEVTACMPLIAWKRTRQRIIVGFPMSRWDEFRLHFTPAVTMACYNGFVFVAMEEFLKIPKPLLFDGA